MRPLADTWDAAMVIWQPIGAILTVHPVFSGTVWGIMNSFIGNRADPNHQPGGRGAGYRRSAAGDGNRLVAAIPAVVIYNIFARMIGSYKATLGDVAAQVLLLQSRDLDLNASSVKPVHAASKLRAG
ncbi:tonB-system energizer ExbB [Enterobacter asburiae]|uniref:TonB-system energizer ExbB n=1 Tax=Enterobacter asburiae TaxID=61645 RepID=A0A376FCW4_ENTAS|nr:tonB-system energizer ExbB [Enterobacter asburiae]